MRNLIEKNNYIIDINSESYFLGKGVHALFDNSIFNIDAPNISLVQFLKKIISENFFVLKDVITGAIQKYHSEFKEATLDDLKNISIDDAYFIVNHIPNLFISLMGIKINPKDNTVKISQAKDFSWDGFDSLGFIYTLEGNAIIAFSNLFIFEQKLDHYFNDNYFEVVFRDPNGYSLSDKFVSLSIADIVNFEENFVKNYPKYA